MNHNVAACFAKKDKRKKKTLRDSIQHIKVIIMTTHSHEYELRDTDGIAKITYPLDTRLHTIVIVQKKMAILAKTCCLWTFGCSETNSGFTLSTHRD